MQDEPGDAIGWRHGCLPPCHWSAAPPDRPQHVQVSCSAQNLHDGSTLKICCTGACLPFERAYLGIFFFSRNELHTVCCLFCTKNAFLGTRILHCYRHCCGSGSVCFRASRIPHYFVRIRIQALISTILWFIFVFLSMKNWCNWTFKK